MSSYLNIEKYTNNLTESTYTFKILKFGLFFLFLGGIYKGYITDIIRNLTQINEISLKQYQDYFFKPFGVPYSQSLDNLAPKKDKKRNKREMDRIETFDIIDYQNLNVTLDKDINVSGYGDGEERNFLYYNFRK